MLPASTLAAIGNVVALNLEPHTTMKVLGAILAPVLSSDSTPARKAGQGGPKPRRATRPRKKPKPQTARSSEARERAIAELRANPDKSLSAIAKATGVSHGTAANARRDLVGEARKQARKETRRRSHEKSKATMPERRQRAERFLKDALARGPKQVSDLEAAAEKAHVDPHSLEQARAELGIVTSRGNAGGVQAVQWSLPS